MPSNENRFAILIGSNNYGEARQLDNSLKDVSDLKKSLIERCEFLEKDIFTLEIKTDNIELIIPQIDVFFDFFSKNLIKNRDIFFFYFSGHGFYQEDESKSYIEFSEIEKISIQEIFDKIKNLKAKNNYLVIDACYSGGDLSLITKSERETRRFLAKADGIYCLFSASKKHESIDTNKKLIKNNVLNSLFTHFFIEALNKKEKYNDDGTISINGIKDYVFNQVESMSEFLQIPASSSNENGYHPFGIWKDFKKEINSNSLESIIRNLNSASISFSNINSKFSGIEDSHISRSEVNDILNWINSSSEDNTNLAFVTGKSGTGKSVIMNDVFLKLDDLKIPVLALKADKLVFNKKKDFFEEIKICIEDIETLSEENDISNIVILIDQIDALSQSLSANREPINFYIKLIQQLLIIDTKKIKIIVSCRTFDINYDQELKNLNENTNSNKKNQNFPIQELDDKYVDDILIQLGVKLEFVNKNLKKLLKTPQNLDVFCRIYNEGLNINSINSLNDLYDKLWEEKIKKITVDKKFTIERTETLLFEMAEEMYKEQKITLFKKKFENKYYDEFNYLQSQDIILSSDKNKELQFFHQSFFDYVLARNFVESNRAISEDLNNKHQGLFIRSSVNQIISYLRDYDPTFYIKEIRSILENDYKYHIQLLIIQKLASENNLLNQEKLFVEKIILKSEKYKNLFLESIISEDWFIFLRDKKILLDLLLKDEQNLIRVSNLCNTIAIQNNDLVFEFLNSLPDFDKKNKFIIDLLYQIKNFSNIIAIQLLDKYKFDIENIQRPYKLYFLYEYIYKFNPKWVMDNILEEIKEFQSSIDENSLDFIPYSHRESNIFNKLYNSYPNESYTFFKEVILIIVEAQKINSNNYGYLLDDSAFYIYDQKSELISDEHYYIFNLIITYLKKKIDINKNFVINELNLYLKSNFTTILNIALSTMIYKPEAFLDQSFNLLTKDYFFEEVFKSISEFFKYQVKKLIEVSYEKFSDDQKHLLKERILSINFNENDEIRSFYKEINYNIVLETQEYKYQLLSCFNLDILEKDPELKKFYDEFSRKFKNPQNEPPHHIQTVYNNIPKDNSYEKMSLRDWKISFDKIGKSKNIQPHHARSDIIEHGRKFTEYTSKKPEMFFPLIEELVLENSSHINYILDGLEGLQKGNYELDKILNIHKLLIKKESFSRDETWKLLTLSEYLIKNNIFDKEIFDYTIYQLLNHPDFGNMSRNINSVRGLSADILIKYTLKKEFVEDVFLTIEKALILDLDSIKHSLLINLKYLLYFDKYKTLDIFLRLTERFNNELIPISINVLSYLINIDFVKLIPFFNKAIESDKNKEIAKLIFIAWFKNYNGSYELLEKVLSSCDKAISRVLLIAFELFIKNDSELKCKEILYRFLDSDSKEIGNAYNRGFHKFNIENFNSVYDFLKDYTISKVGKYRSHRYYEYLKEVSSIEPEKCIELIKISQDFLLSLEEDPLIWDHTEVVNILISAYNAIRKYDTDSEVLEDTINIFDKMLQSNIYRYSSKSILIESDS